MSFLTDLGEGFARLAASDADAGQNITWQSAGVYASGKTGIYIAHVPASPDRILTFTPSIFSDDAVYADSTFGLQVRSRSAGADPRDVYDLDAAVADVLVGRWPMTLPTGVRIQTLERTSSTSLGLDDNQRWSYVSNYTGEVYRPGTHRL